jgi:hypothetical protein
MRRLAAKRRAAAAAAAVGWVGEERNWRESRWGMEMERGEGRLLGLLGLRCVGWIGSHVDGGDGRAMGGAVL